MPAAQVASDFASLADSASEEELINRLRTSVMRLYRRLRTESLGDLSPSQASALAVSPDGKLLASGGPDTTIVVWDVGKLRP